jgi:hypothetical protein|tara:strand:- start:2145 stop:2249 length:105 start_codon:yes stop_codon:yes gene_type:complete
MTKVDNEEEFQVLENTIKDSFDDNVPEFDVIDDE